MCMSSNQTNPIENRDINNRRGFFDSSGWGDTSRRKIKQFPKPADANLKKVAELESNIINELKRQKLPTMEKEKKTIHLHGAYWPNI